MNVTLKQLRIFTEVAQVGSITRAAESLHLTAPAVSMQLKQIESQLGLQLFNRVNNRLSLSTAGKYFIGHAKRVLTDVRESEIAVARYKRLEGGLLTIGIASMAEYFVPEMLARFRNEHPHIEVKLRVVPNRVQLISSMEAAQIDFCVMARPLKQRGIETKPFAPNPLVFVCSPRHFALGKPTLSIKALAGCEFIVREPESGTRMAMDGFFAKHRCLPSISMEITSHQAVKRAVMAGLGVGFLPVHTLDLELRSGLIRVLNVPHTPVVVSWNIVQLESRILSPAAEAFRRFIMRRGARDLREKNDLLLKAAYKLSA